MGESKRKIAFLVVSKFGFDNAAYFQKIKHFL